MRNDVKIRALRRKFGHIGYAVWCYFLEELTYADYFTISYTDIDKELLAADFDVYVEELEQIVDYCTRLGLLEVEDGELFSPAHKKRLQDLTDKRAKMREQRNGESSAQTQQTTAQTPQIGSLCDTNPASKVNVLSETPIIDKNRRDKNIIKENKFSLSINSDGVTADERERFFEIFFFMNFLNPEAEVERFINHYTARGWKPNGSTSPAADREALARGWKPEQQGKHYPDNAMQWLLATYEAAKKADAERAKVILREVERLQTDGIPASHSLVVHCSERAAEVLTEFRAPTKGKVGVKLTDNAQ